VRPAHGDKTTMNGAQTLHNLMETKAAEDWAVASAVELRNIQA